MRSSERTVVDVPADDAAGNDVGSTDEGGPRVRAMGDAAVLVELDDLDAVLAHAAAIEAAGWPGVVDVVPVCAATTSSMSSPVSSATSARSGPS